MKIICCMYPVSYTHLYDFNKSSIVCVAESGGTTVDTVTATKIPDLVCNEEDYTYTVDSVNETSTITGYTGDDTRILLPSTLGGYPVTKIDYNSFRDNGSLATVAFSERCV